MTQQEFDHYVLLSYARFPITIARAEGSYIYDDTGKQYLDFLSGWGVSNLGHRPPEVVAVIKQQVEQLIHVPNVFYTQQQGELAKLLVDNCIPGKVFFSNSGAEANEAAIKFAKLYGQGQRHMIITAEQSFHGRTSGAMAATAQGKIKGGFDPHLQGFVHVPLNDAAALKEAVNDSTLAIMLELVQGEGGVNIVTSEYAVAVKQLCQQHDLLLIVDEVQTGVGRTGSLFAFQQYDLQPDIVTAAKSLASGLPMGATIVNEKIAKFIKPGMHGSTFGGGAVVSAAALATLKQVLSPDVQANVQKLADLFAQKLTDLAAKHACITEVRQKGLMIGLELNKPSKPITDACLEKGLYINSTQDTVIRLLPPLTATAEQVDQAMSILDEVLQSQV